MLRSFAALLLIGRVIHQQADFVWIAQLYLHDPSLVIGIIAKRFQFVDERSVDFDYFTRDRAVEWAHRFHRLDLAKLLFRSNLLPNFR